MKFQARSLKPATFHTRIVIISRWLLWVLIGLVVLVIFWVASGGGRQETPRLVFSKIVKTEAEENVMEEPRYHGTDSNNQPFTVIADKAIQKDEENVLLYNIRADMNQKDGTWLALNAGEGELNTNTRKMVLEKNVGLFYDGGYEFRTQKAYVDIKAGSAYGETPVEGQGPAGTLKADSFSASDHGRILRFNGSVRMTLYP